MSDQPPMRTDVPINLHAASLTTLGATLKEQGTIGSDVFAAAANALQTAHDAWADLDATERALAASKPVLRMIDGRAQKVANPHDLADAADKAFKLVVPQIDAAVQRMAKLEQALDAKAAEAVDDKTRFTPHGIAIATQIRDHLKAQPEGERFNWAMTFDAQTDMCARPRASTSLPAGKNIDRAAGDRGQCNN